MYLLRFIKLLSVSALLFTAFRVHGQSDSIVRVPSPYKNEYNPWYKLTTFQRGFHSHELTSNLDDLERKPRSNWSRADSLNFAKTSLHTGNIALSQYYFNNLNISYSEEESYWWDQMMIFIINEDYEGGIETIHKSRPGILEFTKIYFLDRILQAYIAEKKNNKWHKTNHVLKWDVDSTLFTVDRKGERYQTEVIEPLKNLDFVLKQMIHFIHEDDPIIARACFEMGIIFENHVSLTQAYISYSLGRHYNKWDKEILHSIKAVKAKLSAKKYKIPNFRKYFPRIEHWRFDYEVLKERIIFEKQDTIPKAAPVLMLEPKEPPIPFSPELIVIGGLFLFFILVLLLLKTKKR